MCGAWGKPYGTVACVNIGQVILSIRCKDASAPVIQEALRRARCKFPGRQKIIVSKRWGFTNVNKEDYLKLKAKKRVRDFYYYYYFGLTCVNVGMVLMFNLSVPEDLSRRTCVLGSGFQRPLSCNSSPINYNQDESHSYPLPQTQTTFHPSKCLCPLSSYYPLPQV